MEKDNIRLYAILSINAVSGEISRIKNKDTNDFLNQSKEWQQYFYNHAIFTKVKNMFLNNEQFERFILDFMNNIIYIRNKYIHYYDKKENKEELEKFNCFKEKYDFKISSKNHKGSREVTFKDVLIDYILGLNKVTQIYKEKSIDENLHLIILRIISSKYTIHRVKLHFLNKKKESDWKHIWLILNAENVKYLDLNKTFKNLPDFFKEPKIHYLNTILHHQIKNEPISKRLQSKSILQILFTRDKIQHCGLFTKNEENEKAFFVYAKNKKEFDENKNLMCKKSKIQGVFEINRNIEKTNIFIIKIKDKNKLKEFAINNKYLANLLIHYELKPNSFKTNSFKTNSFFPILHQVINQKNQNKGQLLKSNFGKSDFKKSKGVQKFLIDKFEKYIQNLFDNEKEILAMKILLGQIWKYHLKLHKKQNTDSSDDFKRFQTYFLNAMGQKKNKLIYCLLKHKLDEKDKPFLKDFSKAYELDYDSRTEPKKQIFNKVLELMNNDEIQLGKNNINYDKDKDSIFKIVITGKDLKLKKELEFLRIPLILGNDKSIVDKMNPKIYDNGQKKKWSKLKKDEIVIDFIIKNLADLKITQNADKELISEYKNKFPKKFVNLNLNNYDNKNNEKSSIFINRHIKNSLLFYNILKIHGEESKDATEKTHATKKAYKTYEKYEEVEFQQIINNINGRNHLQGEKKDWINLFFHRDKISVNQIGKLLKEPKNSLF